MRTKFWAKVLSMVTIAAMVFSSCTETGPEETKGSLTVNPTEVSLNADGKSVTNNKAVSVTVTSTSEYSIVSASEWINAKALNKTRLTIEAEKNNQADARTGEVVLKNAENVEAKITVSQLGFAAALEVSTATVEVEANGNEEKPATVTVTSNLDWNATTEAEWVEVEVSENTIVLTVEPSNEFEARTATVNVVPTEASFANLAKTITVNQAAQVYSIEVEAEGVEEGKVTVPSNDAELTFAVTANAAWTISAGDADWVDFGEGEFTATDEEALVIFADNAGTAARTATLTFTCGEATATVEVTQRGAGVFIELVNKVDAISAGSESTSVEVEVKTNATNIQVSTKENANWINGLYDADSKVVTLNIAENTGTPREATVVLTGSLEGAEPSSIEVLVKQNQFAQNLAVNAEGETETANCYAIYKAGCYKFPATVKGNGAGFFDADGYDLDIAYIPGGSTEIDAADIAKATLLWSTKSVVDPQTQVESGLLTDVSVSGGYVYFTMPEPFEVGNAAIAIKDKKGNILWSWHIWATPFDVNAEANTFPVGQTPDSFEEEAGTHTTGYAKPSIFMGLNLGATHSGNNGNCTLDELQASMGYMYNWGRKDPFPGGYPNLE
ncbi:MAG: BACON domain-containing protein, partial [Rikenellaceae bacterium]|nr:BACON domain-containing protein [Rikenellaceae bacterium]